MAKQKPDMSNIFAKTDQAKETQGEEKSDLISSRGLGLRASEWAEVDRIAAEWNITPHGLTVMGVRYFLDQLKAGKIQTETETKVSIKTGK